MEKKYIDIINNIKGGKLSTSKALDYYIDIMDKYYYGDELSEFFGDDIRDKKFSYEYKLTEYGYKLTYDDYVKHLNEYYLSTVFYALFYDGSKLFEFISEEDLNRILDEFASDITNMAEDTGQNEMFDTLLKSVKDYSDCADTINKVAEIILYRE